MELILKNGCIYFPTNDYVVANNAIFNVKLADVFEGDYTTSYTLNNVSKVFDKSFVLDRDEFRTKMFKLKITVHTEEGDVDYFADDVPITRAVVLGKSVTSIYPETIRSLLERVAILEKRIAYNTNNINSNKQSIKALEGDVDLALHAINELNEKGDLV